MSARTSNLIVVLLMAVVLTWRIRSAPTWEARRRLQQLPVVDSRSLADSCPFPAVQEKKVPSTFTASYPGSGAKLTWRLIRAITGIYTGDDHDHNGRVKAGTAVTVKTHFPGHANPDLFQSEDMARIDHAILLIRNPMSAIPSFHNFIYEQQNGLMNHSTRAPVEVWIAWRNQHFEEEVEKWALHVEWWVQQFHKGVGDKFYLLPYEYLISPRIGPVILQGLGNFLGRVHTDIQNSLISPGNYQCVWKMFVQEQAVPGEKLRRESHRTGGPEGDYPYTNVQLEYMIQRLIRLRDLYKESVPEVSTLMEAYIGQIVYRKKIVEGLSHKSMI